MAETERPLWIRLTASFGLIGEISPVAPATVASLAALPLLYFYMMVPIWGQAALLIAVTALGIYVSSRAEAFYGHDGSPIVIDEVAGMMVTLIGVTPIDGYGSWGILIAAFVFFRVFDVLKPFPAGHAQRLPTGWGVMTDDLLAGVYSNLLLRFLMHG